MLNFFHRQDSTAQDGGLVVDMEERRQGELAQVNISFSDLLTCISIEKYSMMKSIDALVVDCLVRDAMCPPPTSVCDFLALFINGHVMSK